MLLNMDFFDFLKRLKDDTRRYLEMYLAAYLEQTKLDPTDCDLLVTPDIDGSMTFKFVQSNLSKSEKKNENTLKDIIGLLESTGYQNAVLTFSLEEYKTQERELTVKLEYGIGSERFGLKRQIPFETIFKSLNPRYFIIEIEKMIFEKRGL
jgi:hypothetical protein